MKLKVILFLTLLVSLAGCTQQDARKMTGYVEGEYVYVAPSTGGILKELSVMRGDQIKSGTPLFSLDDVQLLASLASAKLEVEATTATWQDLCKGSRPEEIEVLMRQLEELKTLLANEEKEFKRSSNLSKEDVISDSVYDARETSYNVARNRIAELEARLAVSKLVGREDALQAALKRVDIAQQKVVRAEKLLQESAPQAVTAGSVEDTYYRPGEYVQPGSPVVCMLPPENVKVRFFVPEELLSSIPLGTSVDIHCDGMRDSIPATVRFISSQAEFTPPVIYSTESREKLSFMVEAFPNKASANLRPGLPVDIVLNEAH